jgi:NAD(P)-dependent dehydrogenase (short-subunit alcohol dehydrogenase family)
MNETASPRIWFITGASRGFGRQWALAALDAGDTVCATARTLADLDDLVEEYADRVHPIRLDITDREGDLAAIRDAEERFGRIDVLVNNAGYGHFGMFEEITEKELREQMEANFFGAFWLSQAVLPGMRARRAGHIIQVSSIGGVTAWPDSSAYHASKWALEGATQALAAEVAGFGIHVTMIEPGGYATDWLGASGRHSVAISDYDAIREGVGAQLAAARTGAPEATRAAILAIVDSPQPPLRVFFGQGPLQMIEADYDDRLATWRAWDAVSTGAQGA